MIDIPKWHEFMRPLLEVLKENGEMYRVDAIEAVVKKKGLTEEQLALVQESNGRSKAKCRVGWASSYLRVAGALSGPRRGYFALGPNAESLLNLGRPIKRADLTGFKEWLDHEANKAQQSNSSSESEETNDLEDDTPEDLIDRGIKRLRSQLIADLLEQVKGMRSYKKSRL